MSLSTVLLAGPSDGDRRFIRNALRAAHWQVVEAHDRRSVLERARAQRPDLILLDCRPCAETSWDATAMVAALRAAGRPVRSTPILAFTPTDLPFEDLAARGFDGCIANPVTAEALIAAVAPWRPVDELAGARRLIDTFGEATIASMVSRFRAQLADALDGSATAASADEQHRLAGIAGTLGFAAFSASWQRLSQGEAAILPVARRDARRTLAQIDRDPRFAATG